MVLPFFFPRYDGSVIRGFGRGEEPSGANILRLIRIRLRAFDCFAPIVVNQEKRFRTMPDLAKKIKYRDAMRDVNAAIEEMRREYDPLASYIFTARRLYQNISDTKSGKRHYLSARLSWQQACDLGLRGDLEGNHSLLLERVTDR